MASSDAEHDALHGPARAIASLIGVRPGEFSAAAWSFVYFFCILGAYYMIRPVREAMAVQSGPETIPYLFAGTFVTMVIATPIFGWIASRYPRKQFLPWIYYFFILNLLMFWVAFSYAVTQDVNYVWLSRVFFVWISIFNLFVVAVFWSFMADLYSREQARRLFGFISAGGSIGALLGGIATTALVIPIGFQNLMPISATLLLFAVFCIRQLRNWVERQDQDELSTTVTSGKPLGGSSFAGVTHVFQSKYFMAIAAKSVLASLLGTALYMFTADLVQDQITNADQRTQFFSGINVATSAIALVGQLLIVKHVVARFGIGISLSLLPLVSIVGFAVLAFEPGSVMVAIQTVAHGFLVYLGGPFDAMLAFVAILTVVRRALGFGFGKPTSDMLYSVVTPEDKYKVKNFIDTVVYRTGDLIGTWTIRFLLAGLGLAGTSVVMLPFAAIWAGIAIWLGRDYKRRAGSITANA